MATGPPTAPDTDLARALRQDLTSYSGPSITFGIMLAGGAYPIVLAAIYMIVGVVFVVWSWASGIPFVSVAAELGEVFLLLIAGGVFCAFIGVVWAAIVSALTLPVVYLFLQSLKLRGSLVGLGAVCGGLVGFVAVLPVTLSLPWTIGLSDIAPLAILLALGPGLTTILGQIGGAWGGRRAAHFTSVAVADAIAAAPPELHAAMGGEATDSLFNSSAKEPRLQFSIRHVLWIFVWLSLILSVIKLSAIPFEFVLPLVVGWLVYQFATLWVGRWLVRRLGPWWTNWRSRRST